MPIPRRGRRSNWRCSTCSASKRASTVEALLGLPALGGPLSLHGDPRRRVAGGSSTATSARYRRRGFRDFKVKLCGRLGRDDRVKARSLAAAGISAGSLRADANNLWNDAAGPIAISMRWSSDSRRSKSRCGRGTIAGMRHMRNRSTRASFSTRAWLRADQLDGLRRPTPMDCQLRVSKMGGLLRSLQFRRRRAARACASSSVRTSGKRAC